MLKRLLTFSSSGMDGTRLLLLKNKWNPLLVATIPSGYQDEGFMNRNVGNVQFSEQGWQRWKSSSMAQSSDADSMEMKHHRAFKTKNQEIHREVNNKKKHTQNNSKKLSSKLHATSTANGKNNNNSNRVEKVYSSRTLKQQDSQTTLRNPNHQNEFQKHDTKRKAVNNKQNQTRERVEKGAASPASHKDDTKSAKNLPNVEFSMNSTKEESYRKKKESKFNDHDEDDYEIGDYDEELEEFEDEKSKSKGKKTSHKSVNEEQVEVIDIVSKEKLNSYVQMFNKPGVSSNRKFRTLPVVDSILKEIFLCGLARKGMKQFDYLTYLIGGKEGKAEISEASKKELEEMVNQNRVIEAQLKRQQIVKRTNKTNTIYNQAEFRADMQVNEECVNWIFKNNRMKYIGSVGLSEEDEKRVMEEFEKNQLKQEENDEEDETPKENSQISQLTTEDLESMSKEELNTLLEKEENIYELYKKYYEQAANEEQEENNEQKTTKENEPENTTNNFKRKLYTMERMIEKTKGIPQIAFIGRSNVGKSSLINAITGRNNLKASERPGETKDLNFHRFGKAFCLIDMPGYGFAFTKDSFVTQKWLELMKSYFVNSGSDLKMVFMLIDSRLGLKKRDVDMIKFLEQNKVPFQIVLTKCDLTFVDDLARMAFKVFKLDPLRKGFTLNYHAKDETTKDYRMIFVSARSKTGVARLKEDIVLKYSSFDKETWKKNVKKNVVLFV
ncbi:hypothetical protein FDP41_011734 [Naegleria fowleri]|uniref:EngB-type G domain-containing protein n=1 Tax=Naegleria fowleri TaxID=5763 RepID=A0A6A5BUW6_NAEFO|nr:uncharacterized protein FDP41_011734 [Naegleria fowleri]KAF0981873.1 hypothetical protein FDP41_011734 [Naegleria fowleri]